ncbi:MAG: hypothetical protein HY908_31470 [Myxococcales bacterium]|nr:hypothetical protein [Myxococcales bacterium]
MTVAPHPLLEVAAFTSHFARPLGELGPVAALVALLAPSAAPFHSDDAVRAAVRDLLRAGGFKPTGRSKPASEYLVRAVGEGALGSINAAVDACNVASFHSGLPVSVVDLERATLPLAIALAVPGARYVFNASGQEIDVGRLLCLHDAAGPCAGPVKDSERTKSHRGTTRTLSIVWGTRALPGRAAAVAGWYRSLVELAGATTTEVELLASARP